MSSLKPAEGRYVKGSVVTDYVRMVRSNPDRSWSEHLLPEDLEQIKQFVLPASWYPIEFFQRIGLAVFKLVAQGNNALLRAYGASLADRLYQDHPGMVTAGNPGRTLERYIQIQRSFYSFDAFTIEPQGPCRLFVHIYSLPDEVGIPVYLEQISGMIERLIVLSNCSNIKINVTTARAEAKVTNTLDVSWDQ